MPTISVTVIVKNEAVNIPDLLSNIEGVADELVIVDTGSIDNTVEIIKNTKTSYKVRLFEQKFVPFHFGKARNFMLDQVACDYVLTLNADERIGDEFRQKVKSFLQSSQPKVVGLTRIDELVPHLKDIQTYLQKNQKDIRWGEDDYSLIHESLISPYVPVLFEPPFFHFQGGQHWLRNPSRMFWQLKMDVARTPRVRTRLSELLHAPIGFFYKFRAIYIRRGTYRDGWRGLAFSVLRAWYIFMLHVKVAFKPRQSEENAYSR